LNQILNLHITIGKLTFGSCSSLESLVFPASLERIGARCFRWCHNLSHLTFESGCALSTLRINHCTSLTYVTFETGHLVSLRVLFFWLHLASMDLYSCVDLRYYERLLPQLQECCKFQFRKRGGVFDLDDSAFEHCSSLKSICLPVFIETLSKKCFRLLQGSFECHI
jgi:hypothetical protein